MQEYTLPERLISFWSIINSHVFWSTNEYKEKEVTQDVGNVVVNQHQDIHVKLCLTDIQVTKAKGTWKPDKVGCVFQLVVVCVITTKA